MVDVAQLVRASDCGSEGRRFEPDLPPQKKAVDFQLLSLFFSLFGVKVVFRCVPDFRNSK